MKILDRIGNELAIGRRVAIEANGSLFVGFVTEVLEPTKVGAIRPYTGRPEAPQQVATQPGRVRVAVEFDYIYPPTPDGIAQIPQVFVLRNPPGFDANSASAGAEVRLVKAKKEAAEAAPGNQTEDDTKPS